MNYFFGRKNGESSYLENKLIFYLRRGRRKMIRETLDEKYSYQIDENNVVRLFRGEEDCQQYLTNPLLSAIFKIEALKKENAELKLRRKIND